MIGFDRIYPNLLDFAKKISIKYKSNLEPIELVNEAFSIIGDEDFSFDKMKNEMQKYLFDEKRRIDISVDFTKPIDKFLNSSHFCTEDKVCSKCKELLPATAFRLKGSSLSYACKKCESVMSYQNKLKNKKQVNIIKPKPAKKFCNKCNTVKDISLFDKVKRKGKEEIFYCCKDCQRDIMNKRQSKNFST